MTTPFWSEDVNICQHFGENSKERYGAVNPPIVQTSLFAYETYEELSHAIKDERHNYVYSRGTNPTVQILERKMAALERGEVAKCFGSGMGAISGALFALLKSGDHVIVVNNVYGPVLQYLSFVEKNNISFTHITENISIDTIKDAIKGNTALIYFESPGTMTFKEVDIIKITELAKLHNIYTMIDNTYATPLFQKPLTLGVDIVAHSLTKYIGGHSDTVAGVIICSNKLMDLIYPQGYQLQGSVLHPQDAYYIIRGLRTLPLRMKEFHTKSLEIAKFLSEHKKVRVVHHPGLNVQSYTKDQLWGYSSLFALELNVDDFETISSFLNNLKLFQKGVSWGGFESLAISPHFGGFDPVKNKGVPVGIIRLCIGLEDTESLKQDLFKALEQL